jgi:hypothetical protein
MPFYRKKIINYEKLNNKVRQNNREGIQNKRKMFYNY